MKNLKKSSVLIILTVLSLNIAAQKYVWPTDASRLLSSTFGEFREGRFHVGIDISTWGRTGYKVFAADSGYVWKVLVSPFGYGRAVYLKLNDGKIIVYGHLQRFSKKLERLVKAEQKKKNSFRIVKYFKKNFLKVKRGELIAYTGESGSGPPHLHFEMRETEAEPINPLLYNFDFIDTKPPVIRKLSFTPVGKKSIVEGDFIPKVYSLKYIKTGRYRLESIVKFYGDIGFGISVFDYNGKNGNKFSPYEIKLQVDGSDVFYVKYDKLSYFKNSRIYIDRDYYLFKTGEGIFHKLYKDLGNDLDIYSSDTPLYGVIPAKNLRENGIGEGIHEFRITVTDFKNNTSILDGKFEVKNIGMNQLENTSSFSGQGTDEYSDYGVEIKTRLFSDFIRIEASNLREEINPEILYNNMKKIPFYKISPDLAAARIDLTKDVENINLSVTQQDEIIDEFKFNLRKVKKTGTVLESEDGNLLLYIEDDKIYSDFWVSIDSIHDTTLHNLRKSDIYSINPFTVPLKNPIRLRLKYNGYDESNPYFGIFSLNEEDKQWRFVSAEKNIEKHWIEAEINEFGCFAILKDDILPIIENVYPADGMKIKNRRPLIYAAIIDELSGIGNGCRTDIYLDNKKMIAEYDPEKNRLFFKVENNLYAGEHRIQFLVEDNIGNMALKTSSFFVVGN